MSARSGLSLKRLVLGALILIAMLAVFAAYGFREDILKASIDPKAPFQTYRPPAAPDYADRKAWALIPADPTHPQAAADPPADVFFIHPTTYDNPTNWNAPVTEPRSQHQLITEMLPNYAGPFAKVGRVFAPQYREATLFSLMTFRDDARDARKLAYDDVRRAFDAYLAQWNGGRPLIVVGVQEGGVIAARLLAETVAKDPKLKQRLVAAYLIDTPVPADAFGPKSVIPACEARNEAGCVVAWAQVIGQSERRAERRLYWSVFWTPDAELRGIRGVKTLCVNPLLGGESDQPAPRRLNLGAANATGLEWGVRPAFVSREVAAQCVGGVLEVSQPASGSLKPAGAWVDRKKEPGFNLFYADLEADAMARMRAFEARPHP